jgi:hypothetical protein
MFCAACGTQLAPGLSYCNRCGMSLKERSEPAKIGPISAFLTAITIIGVGGLGIMLGGTLTLTKDAKLDPTLVGFFMLFTFLIVCITEILLVRQLSRFTAGSQANHPKMIEQRPPLALPTELHQPQPRTLAEPIPSVTENTTRTLEYSHNEPAR